MLTVVSLDVFVREEELHDGLVELVGHLDLNRRHVHLKVLLHRDAAHWARETNGIKLV